MDDSLLTIGSFAELVGLPASALRHYDALGLLSPDAVDDRTGYRYYAPTLIARARLLAGLREAGVGIADMRELVGLSDEARADALVNRAATVEAEGRRQAAALRCLAESQRGGPAGGASLDGAELAAALTWVAPLAGDPPFDRVIVVASPTGSYVAATNRYALAIRRLPPSAGACRALVSAEAAPEAALAAAGVARVDVAALGSDDPGYPDLAAVASQAGGDAVRAVARRAALLALAKTGDEAVDLHGSRFTASLLALCLERLDGDCCVITAPGPERPHRLVDPARPAHELVLMPRRGDAAAR